jgi:hypothetical protein
MELSKTFTDSKTIANAEYHSSVEILTITYITGKAYEYYGVTETVWLCLLEADSIGQFVNNEIKGKYEYKLIN